MVLENLQLKMSYKFRLRTVCTENIASEYSAEKEFVFEGEHTTLDKILSFGTSKPSESLQFTVYPNPTTDFIRIDGNVSDTAKYSIITTTGTLVKKGNASDTRIGVGDLSSGMYILKVQDLKGYTSLKFYKD